MPTYRHPRAPEDADGHPPHKIHVSRSEKAEVASDGTFDAPERVAEVIAENHDTTADAMRVTSDADADEGGTCQAVKNDGEVCGRDLPCRFHTEDD